MYRFACFCITLSFAGSNGFTQSPPTAPAPTDKMATTPADQSHWRDYLQEELVLHFDFDAFVFGVPDPRIRFSVKLRSSLDGIEINASDSDIRRILKRKTDEAIKHISEVNATFTDSAANKLRIASEVDRKRFMRNVQQLNQNARTGASNDLLFQRAMHISEYLQNPCGKSSTFRKVLENQKRANRRNSNSP